jgi:hypothetical protein
MKRTCWDGSEKKIYSGNCSIELKFGKVLDVHLARLYNKFGVSTYAMDGETSVDAMVSRHLASFWPEVAAARKVILGWYYLIRVVPIHC